MSLTIYPLHLGELQVDYSFLVWQTKCGTPTWIPVTAWLVTGAEKPILIDAGFRDAQEGSASTGLPVRRSAEQTLEAQLNKYGMKPEHIGYLIHTHLHMDHAGLDYKLTNARIIVKRKELQAAATPFYPTAFYDRVDIARLRNDLFDRIDFIDEDLELFPGIRTVHAPGHTPAHQMIYVQVPSGAAVIAGDAAMLTEENVKQGIPPGFYYDLGDVILSQQRLAREAKYVLPTHDETVFTLYSEGIR